MKRYITTIIGLLILCMTGIVFGATFDNPVTSSIVNGTALNVTTNSTFDILNNSVQNCSITCSSALTSDTATCTSYNDTVGNITNCTIDTTDMTDASDWTCTGTCYNDTDSATITAITSVTVDNTAPALSSPDPSDNFKLIARGDTLSVTCTNTINATLYLLGTSFAMTKSGNTCSYTFDYIPAGTIEWYVIGDDRYNATTSSTYTILSSKSGGGVAPTGGDATAEDGGMNKGQQLIIIGVIALLLIGGGKAATSKRRRRK